MEIRNFRTLQAIVETGSFSGASKALNYAQSSVTAHIRAIEDFYGMPVFDRIGKRVMLNDFGRIVFHHALKLLDTYDEVCNLAVDDHKPSGTIRIGVPESTMLYRLYPVLGTYKENYPDVEIIMKNSTCPLLRESLRNGELDLVLLLEQKRLNPDLCVHGLIQEDMVIVLPKNYPGDGLDSLDGYSVLYTEEGCSYRNIFQALLAEAGILADNIIETTSVEVIKRYVLCGIGISFLPLVTVAEEIESGTIRHIPWENNSPVILQLAYHKDKWVTPAMAEFIRMIQEEAAGWTSVQ
jgi:DNA-binding transcriptional LysR family regulator